MMDLLPLLNRSILMNLWRLRRSRNSPSLWGVRHKRLALFTLLCLCMAACNAALPAGKATPTASPTPSASIPTPTQTAAPSATPQPPLVLLIVPSGVDAALAGDLQTLFTGLAAQDGLRFQVRPALSTADLEEEVRLAVVMAPDPGLADLAAAKKETQFLAVGSSGLEPTGNLSLVGSQGSRPDQQGFLAGYIAAVVTQDWRVGVIASGEAPAGKAARLGFINGAIFYCGLCRSSVPPFYEYPLYAELPEAASQADAQAAVNYMVDHAVETVYVQPGAADETLLESLAKAEINIIGGIAPPDGLANHWVASIQPQLLPAIQSAWPDLIAGKGGTDLEVSLGLTAVNPELFSPGRQHLVEGILSELQAGYIDTGVDPATGEAR